jgi:hypothetical protein
MPAIWFKLLKFFFKTTEKMHFMRTKKYYKNVFGGEKKTT